MKTLLAIDAGNSFVKYGLFQDGVLVQTWRHETGKTAESCPAILAANDGVTVALASVVPDATTAIKANCGSRTVIEITATQPFLTGMDPTMGADRVAQAVAAYKLHASDKGVVVMAFGTATTLLAISPKGHVIGGWIAPGMSVTLEVLHDRCALLPLLKMESQSDALGWDTDTHMRNGVFLAHVGLARHWVDVARKAAPGAIAVATGGWSQAVAAEHPIFDVVDKDLTLQGIYLIAAEELKSAETQATATPTAEETVPATAETALATAETPATTTGDGDGKA